MDQRWSFRCLIYIKMAGSDYLQKDGWSAGIHDRREKLACRGGDLLLNIIDYIGVCTHRLPSSSFTPQRQNLKDVMKTPTSILLSSWPFWRVVHRDKKKKKLFQIIFFPWLWEFKDLYERNNQNEYSVFNFDSRRKWGTRGRGILVWRCCFCHCLHE